MASLRLVIPRKHSPWVVLDNLKVVVGGLVCSWQAGNYIGRPWDCIGQPLGVLGGLGLAMVGPEVVCGSLRVVMGSRGVALGSLGLSG